MSDVFVILDEVQFEKNSFTNRNQIKTSNGVFWLTVPVRLKGHLSSNIKQIEISDHGQWAKKHWKTIKQNYLKAPFFDLYQDFFLETYSTNWTHLNDLNSHLLSYFLEKLKIDTKIYYLSELKLSGSKQDLVLEICKTFSASEFLFGELGKDYVDKEKFMDSGTEPKFHHYKQPAYLQLWGDFIPNLSVIDMLFNVHPSELKQYLEIDAENK